VRPPAQLTAFINFFSPKKAAVAAIGAMGPDEDNPDQDQSTTHKLQRLWTEPWKAQLTNQFKTKHATREVQLRLQSASGRGAAAWLTCTPRSARTTLTDAEFWVAVRLRLGLPPIANLPRVCACGTATASDAIHLLVCRKLCTARHSWRDQWPANLWDLRHAEVRDTITLCLQEAGVSVTTEPGALAEDQDVRPDHLVMAKGAGKSGPDIVRVATDVTVVECNSAAKQRSGEQADAMLKRRAAEKCATHQAACARARAEFVPLVFSSLGLFGAHAVSFLKLERFSLNDRRLEALHGGFRKYQNYVVDAVACAIARGTARAYIAAVQRLMLYEEEQPAIGRRRTRAERDSAGEHNDVHARNQLGRDDAAFRAGDDGPRVNSPGYARASAPTRASTGAESAATRAQKKLSGGLPPGSPPRATWAAD